MNIYIHWSQSVNNSKYSMNKKNHRTESITENKLRKLRKRIKEFFITSYRLLRRLFQMIHFTFTVFAFPFAVVSLLIHWNERSLDFGIQHVVYVAFALILARSSAMAFNQLVDESFDKENPRTQNREIPKGRLTRSQVLIFIVVNSIGFIVLCFWINPLCGILSPILLLALYFYSFWKRFSFFSHFYLGAVIGLVPIAVELALREDISIESIFLSVALACWISGMDILYSILDLHFDRKKGLFSIPVFFGVSKSLWISRFCYVSMLGFLFLLGIRLSVGSWYYVGLVVVLLLLLQQHLWVRTDYSRIQKAFLKNHWVSVVYLIFFLLDRFLS